MTISSVFIRRPRLAFVISTVITLAGLIALRALPVAQFPDIVPPQVKVTTFYPGASAQAVEESVAQVIEAQVNGVDQMIYMKSGSSNDGSYGLTVTFQPGTNPDIATVNVNGLRAGLTEAIREFCDFRNLLPRGVKIAPEDVWERITFVLSMKMQEPAL